MYFPNVDSSLRPTQRCRHLFDNLKITSAYNVGSNETQGTHLQGGVSVWAINEMVGHSHSVGVDNSGMGRWAYQRISGKGNRCTRIYSIYRPCKSHGDQTTYSQQIRGMTLENDNRCPQQAFLEDLAIEINLARAEGDMFVIQGDLNMDVTSGVFRNFIESIGLINPVLEMHGTGGPATFSRGVKQIDCILSSPEIEVTGCGYLPECCAVGDHLPIWVDFRTTDILGADFRQRIRPKVYRLQPDNPISVKKYTSELKRLIKKENLHNLIENQYDIACDQPDGVCPTSVNSYSTKKRKTYMWPHFEPKETSYP